MPLTCSKRSTCPASGASTLRHPRSISGRPNRYIRRRHFLADMETPLVKLHDASHIDLIGITFEGGLGNGSEIQGGDANHLIGCTFHNLGGYGCAISGGGR